MEGDKADVILSFNRDVASTAVADQSVIKEDNVCPEHGCNSLVKQPFIVCSRKIDKQDTTMLERVFDEHTETFDKIICKGQDLQNDNDVYDSPTNHNISKELSVRKVFPEILNDDKLTSMIETTKSYSEHLQYGDKEDWSNEVCVSDSVFSRLSSGEVLTYQKPDSLGSLVQFGSSNGNETRGLSSSGDRVLADLKLKNDINIDHTASVTCVLDSDKDHNGEKETVSLVKLPYGELHDAVSGGESPDAVSVDELPDAVSVGKLADTVSFSELPNADHLVGTVSPNPHSLCNKVEEVDVSEDVCRNNVPYISHNNLESDRTCNLDECGNLDEDNNLDEGRNLDEDVNLDKEHNLIDDINLNITDNVTKQLLDGECAKIVLEKPNCEATTLYKETGSENQQSPHDFVKHQEELDYDNDDENKDDGKNRQEETVIAPGNVDSKSTKCEQSDKDEGELSDDDVEEGEIKEPGSKRSLVKPTCKYFSIGSCSSGISCAFLHPGVNDKGNYRMIEIPVVTPGGARAHLGAAGTWPEATPQGIPSDQYNHPYNHLDKFGRDGASVLRAYTPPLKRPDEWTDPWRRSKSPKRSNHKVRSPSRKKRRHRSVSDYSRSSRSSSRSSSSSSRSSRSPGTSRDQQRSSVAITDPRGYDLGYYKGSEDHARYQQGSYWNGSSNRGHNNSYYNNGGYHHNGSYDGVGSGFSHAGRSFSDRSRWKTGRSSPGRPLPYARPRYASSSSDSSRSRSRSRDRKASSHSRSSSQSSSSSSSSATSADSRDSKGAPTATKNKSSNHKNHSTKKPLWLQSGSQKLPDPSPFPHINLDEIPHPDDPKPPLPNSKPPQLNSAPGKSEAKGTSHLAQRASLKCKDPQNTAGHKSNIKLTLQSKMPVGNRPNPLDSPPRKRRMSDQDSLTDLTPMAKKGIPAISSTSQPKLPSEKTGYDQLPPDKERALSAPLPLPSPLSGTQMPQFNNARTQSHELAQTKTAPKLPSCPHKQQPSNVKSESPEPSVIITAFIPASKKPQSNNVKLKATDQSMTASKPSGMPKKSQSNNVKLKASTPYVTNTVSNPSAMAKNPQINNVKLEVIGPSMTRTTLKPSGTQPSSKGPATPRKQQPNSVNSQTSHPVLVKTEIKSPLANATVSKLKPKKNILQSRKELLKQLKEVEEAIARKKSQLQ